MSDSVATAPPRGALDRLTAGIAIAGGFLSLALALLVVASVLGRWLFSKPIEGDFELVKMATGITVFSFLPYTQIRRGNIFVDTFTAWLPASFQRLIDALWDLVFALVMGVLTYALCLGTRDFLRSGETTMMHGIVLWPAIATCAALCAVTTVSALATFARMLRRQS